MSRAALAIVLLAAGCEPQAPSSFHVKCPPDPPWRPTRYMGNTLGRPWNDREWSGSEVIRFFDRVGIYTVLTGGCLAVPNESGGQRKARRSCRAQERLAGARGR